MTGLARVGTVVRVAVLAVVLAGVVAPAPAAATSRWAGGIDLYRSGVFTTQKSWLWCTPASIQMVRNIVRHETDHSAASQSRYFDYMRAHDRYRIPVKDGTDPAGWTAGFRRFVDARYRLVASRSFDSALRSAVTNLRRTNLPVGITVAHGNHAWVLTGFTATADPAATTRFTVTSVRVVGPLWGLQSTSYGLDMRPDTKLTPRQLRGFFTPWHYTSVPMAWENRWVSVQPIATTPTAPAPTPPTATPNATPSPESSAAAPATPAPTPGPTPTPSAVAVARADAAPMPSPAPTGIVAADAGTQVIPMLAITLALALAVLVLGLRAGRPSP
jgi:pyruvate/2-oxoglutarate dehydrogenase complex dihydrolipoamide acyltransferase (E2) component